MNDRIDSVPGECARNIGFFGNIAVDEVNAWLSCERCHILALDRWRVITVEIVEDYNLITPRDEPLDDVRADKSGPSSDEYSHDVSSVSLNTTRGILGNAVRF